MTSPGFALRKLTIYLCGLTSTIGMALVSPVLVDMAADFPNLTPAAMGLIVTVPAFFLLPTNFAASWLAKRMDRKFVLVLGIALFLLGGVGPALPFITTVAGVMFCRAVLGLGMGLIMPIPATYISEFPPEDRGKLFSYSQCFNSILGAAIMALVGPISIYGWQSAYLLHLVILPVILFVMVGLPSTGPLRSEPQQREKGKSTEHFHRDFYINCGSLFFYMIAYITVLSYVSAYVNANDLGGAAFSSVVNSACTLFGAVGSLAVPLFMKRLKQWTGAVTLIIGIAAYLIYAIPTQPTLIIGICLIGFTNCMYAIVASTKVTLSLPLSKVALGAAILNTAIFLGQFASTSVANFIAGALGADVYSSQVYMILAAAVGIIMLFNLPFRRDNGE